MNVLFDFIGSIFGYLLYGAYKIVPNFAIAILLFTVFLRIIQFPFQIKSQKSMAGNARLQKKQMELQERYGKDKEKYNEELSKLYEKENVNPMGGCLTSFVPMLLLLGVYGTIRSPLTNTLHIASDKVQEALNYFKGLPVIGANVNQYYGEVELLSNFASIRDNLTCFSAEDIAKIEDFSNGFTFLGLNLLDTPSAHGIMSAFILVPVLCFLTSFGSSMISMKINGNTMQQGQGCMKFMFVLLPLWSAWLAYSIPSAVGLYWIYSNLIGLVSTFILHKFYNAEKMTATEEARRIALLEEEETSVRALVRTYSNNNSAKNKQKKKKK